MSSRPIRTTVRTHADERRSEEEIQADALREAFSHWASGVTVLAVSDGDEIDAITVSAFTPVSLDPPLVLVCVHEHAAILPMLLEEGRFTVNILAEDQRRTASAVSQRLPGSEKGFRAEGDPVLAGSLVSLVCRLHEAYPGGDHRIVVGEVERLEIGPDAEPLLYHRRGYRALSG